MKKLILGLLAILCTLEINAMQSDKDDQFRNPALIEMPNTTWRDDKSGDWLLGIYPEGVVYDCQFWNYVEGAQKKDNELAISNGKKQILINVGVKKNGKRKFVIDGKKYSCSVFTGNLPDYPKRDKELDFADNGYKVDTATIIGWVRHSPSNDKNVHAYYDQFLSGLVAPKREIHLIVRPDSIGRFQIKLPIFNSTTCSLDNPYQFRMPVEPGETYYMVYDFQNVQRIFMGKKSRIMNELASNWFTPKELFGVYDLIAPKKTNANLLPEQLESARKCAMERLDSLKKSKPLLSNRFFKFHRMGIHGVEATFIRMAREAGIAGRPYYEAPMQDLIMTKILPSFEKPYTLWDKDGKSIFDFFHYLRRKANVSEVLTQINADEDFRTLVMSADAFHTAVNRLDSLPADLLRQYREQIKNPMLLHDLEMYNNKRIKISRKVKEFVPKSDSIDFKGMTDGEEIVKKMIAPYKGRMVFVDFWGATCGVSINELSEMKKLARQYSKDDPVFLFLAFNTGIKEWKVRILDYGLTKDNMIHHLLPKKEGTYVRKAYKTLSKLPNFLVFDSDGKCVVNTFSFPAMKASVKDLLSKAH